jgi:hypothetical protein
LLQLAFESFDIKDCSYGITTGAEESISMDTNTAHRERADAIDNTSRDGG